MFTKYLHTPSIYLAVKQIPLSQTFFTKKITDYLTLRASSEDTFKVLLINLHKQYVVDKSVN